MKKLLMLCACVCMLTQSISADCYTGDDSCSSTGTINGEVRYIEPKPEPEPTPEPTPDPEPTPPVVVDPPVSPVPLPPQDIFINLNGGTETKVDSNKTNSNFAVEFSVPESKSVLINKESFERAKNENKDIKINVLYEDEKIHYTVRIASKDIDLDKISDLSLDLKLGLTHESKLHEEYEEYKDKGINAFCLCEYKKIPYTLYIEVPVDKAKTYFIYTYKVDFNKTAMVSSRFGGMHSALSFADAKQPLAIVKKDVKANSDGVILLNYRDGYDYIVSEQAITQAKKEVVKIKNSDNAQNWLYIAIGAIVVFGGFIIIITRKKKNEE